MFWIVSYDIPNDKRRSKVAKILEGHGRRAQYSPKNRSSLSNQSNRLDTLTG
jgi:CRISPR-associated protein Cas2